MSVRDKTIARPVPSTTLSRAIVPDNCTVFHSSKRVRGSLVQSGSAKPSPQKPAKSSPMGSRRWGMPAILAGRGRVRLLGVRLVWLGFGRFAIVRPLVANLTLETPCALAMNERSARYGCLLCLVLALPYFYGCSNRLTQAQTFRWPWDGPPPDEMPGVTPPAKRIQQLQEQAKATKDMKPEEREALAGRLCQLVPSETDPLVRMQVMRTLDACNTPAAQATLVGGLNDNDSDVRITCCEICGRRGGPEAARELGRVISSDTNLDVRVAAARALGQTHDAAAIPALGEALADSDPALQRRAVESLKSVSGQDYGNDVGRWQQYAKSTNPEVKPQTLVSRFWKLF